MNNENEYLLTGKNILVCVDIFPSPITNYILNHITGIIEHGANVKILTGKITSDNSMPEFYKYKLAKKMILHPANNRKFILKQFIHMIKRMHSIELIKKY